MMSALEKCEQSAMWSLGREVKNVSIPVSDRNVYFRILVPPRNLSHLKNYSRCDLT